MTRAELGERLRAKREICGASQRAIADRVGVSAVTISQGERGEVGIGWEVLTRWCEALGTNISELTHESWQPAPRKAHG